MAFVHLTPRELETLIHVASGYTNKEMACLMNVGESTVETFIISARLKFGAWNRAHMVALAFASGTISRLELIPR